VAAAQVVTSMNARTNLILLAAAASLAVFIVGVERRRESTDVRLDRQRRAFAFAPERVASLRIETPAFTVAAEREDDLWWIVEPVRAPADATEIARILHGIQATPRVAAIPAAEVGARSASMRDYGLDRPRGRVSLSGPDIALRIEIGEPTVLGQLYLRSLPGGDILATATNFLGVLPPSLSTLRNRTLFPPVAAEVRQIRIRRPDGFVHLARGDGGGWRTLQPAAGRADRSAVARLLEGLLSARITEFVQDGVAEGAPFGLDETAMEITIDYDRDDVPPVTLQVGRAQDRKPGSVYARRAGADTVFTLPVGTARLLATPLDELRDRRLVPLLPEDVGSFVIEKDDRRLRLVREGDAWRIAEPVAAAADETRVRSFLQEWAGTRVEEFATPLPALPAPGGVETRILLYRRVADAGSTNTSVSAGTTNVTPALALSFRETPLDMTPVRVADAEGTATVLIRTKAPGFLSPDALRFRDLAVLAIPTEEVGGVILARPGFEQRVVRGATNEFVTAEGDPIPGAAVAAKLRILAALRASALVAENPAEMIAYGLDPPAATLTVTLRSGAGLARSLLFGRSVPGGVHAAIRGQDLVFLLDPATAGVLQADLYARPAPAPAGSPTNHAPEAPR
jgi:hypothetical protein